MSHQVPTDRADAQAPTGAVTFFLTDVEGSTRMWQSHAESMAGVVHQQRMVLTEAVRRHDGYLPPDQGEGDSVFAAFSSPRDALQCAIESQRTLHEATWPDGLRIDVRIALHTGEAEIVEGNYSGVAVNRCARLRAIGHGGQTLVSLATCELVKAVLPDGVTLVDLGTHRLKDFADPEHVLQLTDDALPRTFPPLKSLDAVPNNVPLQLSSFVGRTAELMETRALLSGTRLLTLAGPGGCGKTRLAVELAASALDRAADDATLDAPDGVWLVELASIGDERLVDGAVAAVLGVHERQGATLRSLITERLAAGAELVILDNCEHVLDACASLADFLLRACPKLRVLVTSREPLAIDGEVVWRVPPMGLPDGAVSVSELAGCDAVRLFVERAKAAASTFELNERTVPGVAEICRRLDGIPLALELAAARVGTLGVDQIVRRLEDRFKLLTGRHRGSDPRQSTLLGAIEWSHSLLSEEEKMLFRRLAVFAGSFSLEAAEAVGCADGDVDVAVDVLDALSQLVSKSLVLAEGAGDESRYRMLESVREFAKQELGRSGELGEAERAHCDWYVELAEIASRHLAGPAQFQWLDRLEAEHENIRAVMERGAGSPDEGRALLRLVAVLMPFWTTRGYLTEGRLFAELALAGAPHASDAELVQPMLAAGSLARLLGDNETAASRYEDGLDRAALVNDHKARAHALNELGMLADERGDAARAREFFEESLATGRALNDRASIAHALNNLGAVAWARRDFEMAAQRWGESLKVSRELGDAQRVAETLGNLGVLSFDRGDSIGARAFYEESLAIRRESQDRRGIAEVVVNLGLLAMDEGSYEEAGEAFLESLGVSRSLGDKRGESLATANLGDLAGRRDDLDSARAYFEQSIALSRHIGDARDVADSLCFLATVLRAQGAGDAAVAAADESRTIAAELGDGHLAARALIEMSRCALQRGRVPDARDACREALDLATETADHDLIACGLEVAGALVADETAVILLSAATRLRGRSPRWPCVDPDRLVAELRSRLAGEVFARAWDRGSSSAPDEIARLARAALSLPEQRQE